MHIPKKFVAAFFTLCASAIPTGATLAATVSLHSSAIDTALYAQVFTQEGKRVLSGALRTCAYAYVESPRTRLHGGRLFLKVHFAARAAAPVQGNCVGTGDAFDIVVSARPYFKGTVLGLEDFRLEEGKEAYRPLLEILVVQAIPFGLHLDLREEVAKMLRDPRAPYQVSVPSVTVQSVSAEDDVLSVGIDFQVEAK